MSKINFSLSSKSRLSIISLFLLTSIHSKGETMINNSNIVQYLDEKYPMIIRNDSNELENIEIETAMSSFQGIAISAPKKAKIEQLQKLPIIFLSRQTILRSWEVSKENNLKFAFTDLNSGTVTFSSVFIDDKNQNSFRSKAGPKPSEYAGTAELTFLKVIDLLDHIKIGSKSGPLSVTALSFDWISNSSIIEITPNNDLEIEPADITIPSDNQIYSSQKVSFLPNDIDIKQKYYNFNFTAERSLKESGNLILTGAFSKAVKKNEFLLPTQAIKDQDTNQTAVASVHLSFIITGLDWNTPIVKKFGIPIYKDNVTPNSQGYGYFSLELPIKENKNQSIEPGLYMIYAVMDGIFYGPIEYFIE